MILEKVRKYVDGVLEDDVNVKSNIQELLDTADNRLRSEGVERGSDFYTDSVVIISLLGLLDSDKFRLDVTNFDGVYQYYRNLQYKLGYTDFVVVVTIYLVTHSEDTKGLWGYEKALIAFVKGLLAEKETKE